RTVSAATEPTFVARSQAVVNPYGDGTFVSRALSLFDQLSWPPPLDKPWLPWCPDRISQS
ncbi:MAG: hypothetical protein ACO3IZ_09740, partial [Steroidobacteraceae bacterium]